jgi:hypothetical protein
MRCVSYVTTRGLGAADRIPMIGRNRRGVIKKTRCISYVTTRGLDAAVRISIIGAV